MRRLVAIISSISNKLTSSAGVDSTQWQVSLWHNSIGIVVLKLQVGIFFHRANCVSVVCICKLQREIYCWQWQWTKWYVVWYVFVVCVLCVCVCKSCITAPNMKFEQTSWHRNWKLVGRSGTPMILWISSSTNCCSFWMSCRCLCLCHCHCYLFRTLYVDETWQKLIELNNLHSSAMHCIGNTVNCENFFVHIISDERVIFTSRKFESIVLSIFCQMKFEFIYFSVSFFILLTFERLEMFL